MPGIVGSAPDGGDVRALSESLTHESWYECDRVSTGDAALGVIHHGEKDASSDLWYEGDGIAGVLHGVVSKAPPSTSNPGEFFRAVLDRPTETLAATDGLFTLACADADDRLVLSTDKLGSRPCYYRESNDFLFASEVSALAPTLDDPTLDLQAISDMVLFGHTWGESTLLDGVSELRPARVLTHADGETTVDRYWRPSFGRSVDVDYPRTLLREYRASVRDVVGTVEGTTGVWLSGGLDSRMMASALREELDAFHTMTYEIPDEDESEPARRVAAALGVENDRIELGPPDAFADVLDRAIRLTDGMVAWSYLINTTHMLDGRLAAAADVVFEAAPQELYFGDDIWDYQRQLVRNGSLTDALASRYAVVDPRDAAALVDGDVDPVDSLRQEVTANDHPDAESVFRDVVWHRAAYGHFRSSRVPRSQVGTRVPFAASDFLNVAADRPPRYHKRTVPHTGGRVSIATTSLKLELTRMMNHGLDEIPYQRTGLAPSAPQWLHTVGLAKKRLRKRLRGPKLYAHWYRTDPTLRSYLDDLLDSAASRPHFDADAIAALRSAHLDGKDNHIKPIAAITSVERWTQEHLDRSGRPITNGKVPTRS
ncbi:asparagine synthase-related protein [Halegenticoccus tardaugens]|uniref:asparagine synthase-related protein n=1 Tax=Halegenticoccus tardaugens TaxID=2071624 RepID=UPI00100B2FC5|nr:asparagine synthase-related protein [Halegenticoccus tardaugens]